MSLPPKLDQIVRLMSSSPKDIKIEALLDYSRRIPPLPDHISRESLEQVHECQTPFFLVTEIDDEGRVHMFFDAPPESPTVRGFAGILLDGLEGETPATILDVPTDFIYQMGLEEVVTPQRLNGMVAILSRIKRQLAEA
ncbi:MAG: SufE family protein [Acidimicrobiia bacterium]|nr:SufE family protein [Acidimicrobiia bacterium]